MRSTYENSDVHLRYDCGRTLNVDATRAVMEFLLRHAPCAVNSVVDIGCGTGRFTGILAETFGVPVVGVEPAPNMRAVAEGRQLCGTVRFVAGSAEHIPLDDCTSDIVFMSQVFHHIADKALALREIRRVLRPNGRFVLRQTTLENLDSYFYQRFFPEARRLDEQRLSSRAEVLGIANDCGYRLVGFDCSPYSIAATPDEYLEKIALRTFSDLEYISDEAFHRGLDAFRRYSADHPDFPKTDERDLFAFVRP